MTVRENITLCTLSDVVTAGLVSARRERQMAAESVELLGIRMSDEDGAVTSLSGGNQQKCMIARWLRTKPKVLLLDDSNARRRCGSQSGNLSNHRPALPGRVRDPYDFQRVAGIDDLVRPNSGPV